MSNQCRQRLASVALSHVSHVARRCAHSDAIVSSSIAGSSTSAFPAASAAASSLVPRAVVSPMDLPSHSHQTTRPREPAVPQATALTSSRVVSSRSSRSGGSSSVSNEGASRTSTAHISQRNLAHSLPNLRPSLAPNPAPSLRTLRGRAPQIRFIVSHDTPRAGHYYPSRTLNSHLLPIHSLCVSRAFSSGSPFAVAGRWGVTAAAADPPSGRSGISGPNQKSGDAGSGGEGREVSEVTVSKGSPAAVVKDLFSEGIPDELSDEFFEEASATLSDEELDSVMLMRDLTGVPGLPPLEELLADDDEAKARAARREAEKEKQAEIARRRVACVDALGRAYGTGRRKTSVARVWLRKGSGGVVVNGRPLDLYFPDLSQRAAMLEPFLETGTAGEFDVKATVKGGGISGQAGAMRHGISRALQQFDPTYRPALKSAGLLTRDSRMVERKKPGKAKARKSFQWVKR
ncbi:hypothetical protein CLOM_g20098 [Closterium sp. NIES-68]|nr:hypothetical protein CLOM_g20098 [Closterium sp. NIES-68]GJP85054.1 hypothetical protein CLOP_g15158 [Closterium sp. NIES-67]